MVFAHKADARLVRNAVACFLLKDRLASRMTLARRAIARHMLLGKPARADKADSAERVNI